MPGMRDAQLPYGVVLRELRSRARSAVNGLQVAGLHARFRKSTLMSGGCIAVNESAPRCAIEKLDSAQPIRG